MTLKLDSLFDCIFIAFGGLQIYMTLKRIVERGEKVETFEVLQIYMILKLLNIVANLLDTSNLHDSQTEVTEYYIEECLLSTTILHDSQTLPLSSDSFLSFLIYNFT